VINGDALKSCDGITFIEKIETGNQRVGEGEGADTNFTMAM